MTEAPRRLVKLDPARTLEAARTLARAFMDDPLMRYTLPDPALRAERLVPHYEAMVRYGLLAGHVWATEGDIDAVGIWLPPEHRGYREELFEEAGFNRLPEALGEEAFARYLHVILHLEKLHKLDLPEPHWYAMELGVDPGHQGRGLGRLLLQKAFDVAGKQGAPCYLETEQPANVRFYTGNGFKVLREETEPVSGLRYWTFLREPS